MNKGVSLLADVLFQQLVYFRLGRHDRRAFPRKLPTLLMTVYVKVAPVMNAGEVAAGYIS
jgi:hypothetical protein